MPMQRTIRHAYDQSGFTLVELAISLLIIGLLIGGVLKGQELLKNAQDVQYVRQIAGYETAVKSFRTIYNAVPGDMVDATTRLPGCGTDPCLNGDGNKFVGALLDGGGYQHQQIGYSPQNALIIDGERRKFWVHLQAANLIAGVSGTRALGTAYSNEAGIEMPKASSEIVWAATAYDRVVWGDSGSFLPGNYLVLRSVVQSTPPITASTADYIDQKRDDGKAMTGLVRPGGDTDPTPPANCVTVADQNVYNITNKAALCYLVVKM